MPGRCPESGAWPTPLLSVYLERSAAELGLADGIRVSVLCAEAARPAAVAGAGAVAGAVAVAGSCPGAGQVSAGGPAGGQAPASGGYLAGYTLAVTGDHAQCSWHAADPAQAGPAADPRLAGLRTELARRFGEPRATLNARLRAIADCLPPPDPREPHLTVDSISSERWVLLRTGGAVIACTVAEISGVPLPVAMAIGGSAGPDSPDSLESPDSTGTAQWSTSRGCAV